MSNYNIEKEKIKEFKEKKYNSHLNSGYYSAGKEKKIKKFY